MAATLKDMFLNLETIVSQIPEDQRWNIFYTVAHHNGAGSGDSPINRKDTFSHQEALVWDLDGPDMSKQDEYIRVVTEALGYGQDAFTIVRSGNGLHFILFLPEDDDCIDSVEYFRSYRRHYKALAEKVNSKIRAAGLPIITSSAQGSRVRGGVDLSMFDPVQLLRLPGTENRKPNKPVSHASIFNLAVEPLPFDLSKASGLGDLEADNLDPRTLRREFPKVDAVEVVRSCKFLSWMVRHPEEIHEPQMFDAMSILAVMPGDAEQKAILLPDREPAEVPHYGMYLAQKLMQEASSSASLQMADFDQKWEQSTRYGCRKCDTIHQSGWEEHTSDPAYAEGCLGCDFYGLISVPVALKRSDFVASSGTGFWMKSESRGKLIEIPNYDDLCIEFGKQHYFVQEENSQMLRFNGKYYSPYSEHAVKAWVESVMFNPKPKEVHRKEALNKILSNNVLPTDEIESIMGQGVCGKVNCNNGILDVMTGEMHPHGKYPFQYVLPIDYNPRAMCPYFDAWLREITCKDEEVERLLLEVMAYCLWPVMSDHVFVVLAGSGANGKSTFAKFLSAVLGKNNVSAVGLQQLTENKFAPAMLRGKLANIAGEIGNGTVRGSAMARLKELSSDDPLVMEEKFRGAISRPNTAKLIFATNETPRFDEGTEAIARRMILVPFKFDILQKHGGIDMTLEDYILENELPGILNKMVRTLKGMIERNRGKPKIWRQANAVLKATKDHFESTNPVATWLLDNYEVTNNAFDMVPMRVLVNEYNDQAPSPMHKMAATAFGVRLRQYLHSRVSPELRNSDRTRINGRVETPVRGIKPLEQSNY